MVTLVITDSNGVDTDITIEGNAEISTIGSITHIKGKAIHIKTNTTEKVEEGEISVPGVNEYRKEYEPVKTVYIIQRFWHDPYVSLFESSMGYEDVGECATEEEAKRIVKFGGLRYIDSVEYSFFRYRKKEK